MSKERDLLKRLAEKDMVQYYYGSLVNEIQQLLSQPEQTEQDDLTPSSTKLQDRIKDYLSMGGLFNPELVNHGTVRDLILDARAAPPKRKPFGPEERQRISKAYSTIAEQVAFEEGVIFAEISYGIGVADERKN